jgi:hypothetical protein
MINNQQARPLAGGYPYVCIRPFTPPVPDQRFVGRSAFLPFPDKRVLADVGTVSFAA